MNRKCTIIYNQRRYYCPTCEFSFHENNPFINTKENVTLETKVNVLIDLKDGGVTYTLIAKRYNLSVTKVQNIFDKHVDISRKTLPRVLSIDEHYFPSSSYDCKRQKDLIKQIFLPLLCTILDINYINILYFKGGDWIIIVH